MSELQTYTLEAPGATIAYDVRDPDGGGSGDAPLMLVGSPMDAGGFVTLAGHFGERTIVTYDPRGVARSEKADPATSSTPDQHADDIRRVIEAVGLGPVDLFASSGGAVNALALVARHPEVVRTLVAHEPPAAQVVDDREQALAATSGIAESYQRDGLGPAMAKFIAIVSHEGPFPDGYADQPGPDPAMFGLPAEDDGSRDDPLLSHNIITCNAYRHDFDALRTAPTRVVIGVGAKSGQQLAGRAGAAVAGRLGTTPVTFPGDHGGFLGGEYGQAGEPDAFAATLREVLTA